MANRTSDIQEYKEFIEKQLLDLAWENKYPINPLHGTFCFIEAFKRHGFEVEKRENEFKFRTTVDLAGQVTSLESELSLEAIARGWRYDVPFSPGAFYSSMHSVYDRVKEEPSRIKPFSVQQIAFSSLRDSKPREIRETFEELLLESFRTYQEHLLRPIAGGDLVLHPNIHRPQIFDEVVTTFPWELFDNARRISFDQESTCTPTVEELILEYPSLDPTDFTPYSTNILMSPEEIRRNESRKFPLSGIYHPTQTIMDELFLGMYLQRLAGVKGYPLTRSEKDKRRQLAFIAERNFHALTRGPEIFMAT